jgi:excisionase family DNA binding protein
MMNIKPKEAFQEAFQMKSKPETDELYRLDAAARRWNVAVKTARVWVSQGRVAHCRVGRGIRIPLSEVNRIIAEGYRPAKSA